MNSWRTRTIQTVKISYIVKANWYEIVKVKLEQWSGWTRKDKAQRSKNGRGVLTVAHQNQRPRRDTLGKSETGGDSGGNARRRKYVSFPSRHTCYPLPPRECTGGCGYPPPPFHYPPSLHFPPYPVHQKQQVDRTRRVYGRCRKDGGRSLDRGEGASPSRGSDRIYIHEPAPIPPR